MKISEIKKVNTGFLPTPMHEMKNLTTKLNKANLLIKRDDLTGIGFGGNKLRKLDYIVKDALDGGYTTLLTYGGPQTNHGRLTAAAAARFGMKSIIMCYGQAPKNASGNILLDRILGAEICFMDTTEVRKLPKEKMVAGYHKLRDDSTKKIIERYEAQGDKVYIVPIGGHSELGTLGYIEAVKEIMEQLALSNSTADYLVAGLGSGGTFAGLWLGAKYYRAPFQVIGVSVSPLEKNRMAEISQFINQVSETFELGISCQEEELWVENDFYGQGYNIPDEKTREYLYLLARTEGIFVDPCYTGKTFRGFVDLVESEKIPADKTAIYLHTGGQPGLYTEEHIEAMQAELWENQVTRFEFAGL